MIVVECEKKGIVSERVLDIVKGMIVSQSFSTKNAVVIRECEDFMVLEEG